MKNNWISLRTSKSLAWSVAILGAGGLGIWLAQGKGVAMPIGAAALVVTAFVGITWFSRARAVNRFNAALDDYAEREIDRARRRNPLQRLKGDSSRGVARRKDQFTNADRAADATNRFTEGRSTAVAARWQRIPSKGEE